MTDNINIRVLGAFVLSLLMLGGCTMAPWYERPETPVTEEFPDYPEYEGIGSEGKQKAPGQTTPKDNPPTEDATDELPAPGNVTWREFYADPNMQRLIEFALENSRDLRMAVLNVEAARALYQIQRADLLPGINATGSAVNQRTRTFQPAPAPESSVSRTYNLGVGVTSWEVDLFGRVRSLKDAALEQYLATRHAAYATRIAIVGEVASLYLNLVSTKEQYELTRNTYETRLESFNMVDAMYRQGLASQLTVNQAKTALEEARVNAVTYRTSMLQLENALFVLIGGPIPADVKIPSSLSAVRKLNTLPEGMPSYLLERRPDILQAEHQLRSVNANIGAARANFFPRISLTGSLGFISGDLDDLFDSNSKAWAFTPSVTLPIFQGGRNVANLEYSHVQKDIAVAQYEKTIQTAFREVSDALAQRSTITEHLDASRSLRDASQQSYDISNVRYEIGVDSFLNVLDAQRTLFAAQQGYINSLLLREINSINLYKSLGGGWE